MTPGNIDKLLKTLNLKDLNNICEIGVNSPELAQFRTMYDSGNFQKALLIEPLPNHAKALRARWENKWGKEKLKVMECACTTNRGKITLWESDQGSYIDEVPKEYAPTVMYGFHVTDKKIDVDGIPFREIDSGDFDAVAIDVEGFEWNILKEMISRPKLLIIETHCVDGPVMTVDPNMQEILDWTKANGYRMRYIAQADIVWTKE